MASRGPLSPKAEAVLLLGEHLALTNDSLFTGTEHLLQVATLPEVLGMAFYGHSRTVGDVRPSHGLQQ